MRGRDVIFFDSVISLIYRNVSLREKWTRTNSLPSRAQMLQKSSTFTPQKGVIAHGSDADIGIWDPTQQGIVDHHLGPCRTQTSLQTFEAAQPLRFFDSASHRK